MTAFGFGAGLLRLMLVDLRGRTGREMKSRWRRIHRPRFTHHRQLTFKSSLYNKKKKIIVLKYRKNFRNFVKHENGKITALHLTGIDRGLNSNGSYKGFSKTVRVSARPWRSDGMAVGLWGLWTRGRSLTEDDCGWGGREPDRPIGRERVLVRPTTGPATGAKTSRSVNNLDWITQTTGSRAKATGHCSRPGLEASRSYDTQPVQHPI